MTLITVDGQTYNAFTDRTNVTQGEFAGDSPEAEVKVCTPDGKELWRIVKFADNDQLQDDEGSLYPAAEDLACRRAVEELQEELEAEEAPDA